MVVARAAGETKTMMTMMMMRMTKTRPAPRTEGLRRIPTTSLGMTVTERDNVVSIELDFAQRNYALEISVPRRTSVHAQTVQGGDVKVTGVTGEHELENVNGESWPPTSAEP